MDTDELIHYGVLGMRWGQRKRFARAIGGTAASSRRAYSLSDRLKSAEKHESDAASSAKKAALALRSGSKDSAEKFNFSSKKSTIKAEIKRNRDKEIGDYFDEMDAAQKKHDKLRETSMSELKKRTDLGVFSKMIEKRNLNYKLGQAEALDIGGIEDRYEKKWNQQKNNIRSDKKAAFDKMQSESKRYYREVVKNLPFPKDIVAAVKMDRQLERQLQIDILESRARNAT